MRDPTAPAAVIQAMRPVAIHAASNMPTRSPSSLRLRGRIGRITWQPWVNGSCAITSVEGQGRCINCPMVLAPDADADADAGFGRGGLGELRSHHNARTGELPAYVGAHEHRLEVLGWASLAGSFSASSPGSCWRW